MQARIFHISIVDRKLKKCVKIPKETTAINNFVALSDFLNPLKLLSKREFAEEIYYLYAMYHPRFKLQCVYALAESIVK